MNYKKLYKRFFNARDNGRLSLAMTSGVSFPFRLLHLYSYELRDRSNDPFDLQSASFQGRPTQGLIPYSMCKPCLGGYLINTLRQSGLKEFEDNCRYDPDEWLDEQYKYIMSQIGNKL